MRLGLLVDWKIWVVLFFLQWLPLLEYGTIDHGIASVGASAESLSGFGFVEV
jgi:hypothetical protein